MNYVRCYDYRDQKIWVCGKNSVPFTIYFTGDTDNKYVHSKTFKKPA